jgi:hypothetical protein
MINYLSPFIPQKAQLTEPLRMLVKENSPWVWGEAQKNAMQKIKEVLLSKVVLQYYDPKKELTIQADSSKDGLGACLMQEGQPLAFASRPLTETERRYAQIEKEMLAIVFAARRFHHYIYGNEVTVQSDHKPLESIQDKDFDKMSPRLQLMRYKLLRYNLRIVYHPGSTMHIADTLSRAYIPGKADKDENACLFVHGVMTHFPTTKQNKQLWKEATLRDYTSQRVKQYLQGDWPDRESLPPELIPYFDIREQLYEEGDLLFYANRLIIPYEMRAETLKKLHEGHQGMEKSKCAARERIFWPGITKAIEQYVSNCSVCQQYRRRQPKEPITQMEIPNGPWQRLGADIFQFGNHDYVLFVDYYSKYPEIARLTNKTGSAIVNASKVIMARHGIPQEVIADNMPFASYEYRKFAQDWGFTLKTSSPRYPQSNGEAEKYVGIVKTMLLKCEEDGSDPNLALLRYRNAPLIGLTYSPAQLLFNRRLRDDIPVKESLLEPQIPQNARQQLLRKQDQQAKYYNRSAKKRNNAEFVQGDNVRIKMNPQDREWIPGKVVNQHYTPRSYVVVTDRGETVRRNRTMINRTPENVFVNPPNDEAEVATPLSPEQPNHDLTPTRNLTPVRDRRRSVLSPAQNVQHVRRPVRETRPPNWHKDYVVNMKR